MGPEQALELVATTLSSEVRKHRGHIGRLETRLGRSPGYLKKICRNVETVPLHRFLAALDVLGLEPGKFFATAFEFSPPSDQPLRKIAAGVTGRSLSRIAKALRLVEDDLAEQRALALDPAASANGAGRLVEDLMAQSKTGQRRRLRQRAEYRAPSFVQVYLDRLDELRFERPRDVAQLAETVIVDLVPRLDDQRVRLALQCYAVGVYCSCRRQLGHFAAAASGLVLALEPCRRHQLRGVLASLLERGAYVLSDHGEYRRALAMLDETQVLFCELGARTELGKTLVDRGIMLGHEGRWQLCERSFAAALRLLPDDGSSAAARRNRLSAFQGIAVACRHLGELERAERYLARATRAFNGDSGLFESKILWMRGTIALERRDPASAERHLSAARDLVAKSEHSLGETLIVLDLAKAILAQGRAEEVCLMVKQMASMLGRFRAHPVAESALMELMRAGLRGEVTRSLLDRVASSLRQEDVQPSPTVLRSG